MSEKNELKSEEVRVGVYTCKCGGNIGDVVRCEAVAKALEGQDNVVISRIDMSMCSDAGQALIEEDIKEKGVNRVVIGACAQHGLQFKLVVLSQAQVDGAVDGKSYPVTVRTEVLGNGRNKSNA